MRAFVLLSIIAVAGCAQAPIESQPQHRWVKPGATADDFDTDWGYCEAQAAGAPTRDAYRVALVLGGCMKGRGWRLVDQ